MICLQVFRKTVLSGSFPRLRPLPGLALTSQSWEPEGISPQVSSVYSCFLLLLGVTKHTCSKMFPLGLPMWLFSGRTSPQGLPTWTFSGEWAMCLCSWSSHTKNRWASTLCLLFVFMIEILHQFQVYNMMIQYTYTLQHGHHNLSS